MFARYPGHLTTAGSESIASVTVQRSRRNATIEEVNAAIAYMKGGLAIEVDQVDDVLREFLLKRRPEVVIAAAMLWGGLRGFPTVSLVAPLVEEVEEADRYASITQIVESRYAHRATGPSFLRQLLRAGVTNIEC